MTHAAAYEQDVIAWANEQARLLRAGQFARLDIEPSLKHSLDDTDWWCDAWNDALARAIEETGLSEFPDQCPWVIADILCQDWKPD